MSDPRASFETAMLAALAMAVAHDELTVEYQPQVSLDNGKIVGAEALLRWRSPQFGLVPPNVFVPLAERGGLIDSITDWLLLQVCGQSAAWAAQGLPAVRLSVNFSPLQVQGQGLVAQVHRALVATGADPRHLGIELTETTLMEDPQHADRLLRELKALGMQVALDDFGTGYSSLSCLRSLPVDVVNIDRSFVGDIAAAPESASLTRSIIHLAHGLHMQVLAEGVETEEQVVLLLARGCDRIQGNWFSAPVPGPAMAAMLAEARSLPAQLTAQRGRQRTLLLVDDEENVLNALRRVFRRDGYRILTAGSGAEGLQVLAQTEVDLIISDQRMPGMSGVDFLRRACEVAPDTVRMTLSGYAELQSILDAVNEGAIYKFLTKPWDDDRLREHVAAALRHKDMDDENRRLGAQLTQANLELATTNALLEHLLMRQRSHTQLLKDGAEALRRLLDSLPLAVLGIDPDGLLAYCNQQACNLLPEEQRVIGQAPDPAVRALFDQPEAATDSGTTSTDLAGQQHRIFRRQLPAADGIPRGELLVLTPTDGSKSRLDHLFRDCLAHGRIHPLAPLLQRYRQAQGGGGTGDGGSRV